MQKIRIAENIKMYRKDRRLTQEQLAEAFGVTVGAVSKWESGASTPDVSLIVEMASFFETSVDVLLGYEWHKGAVSQYLDDIHKLRNEKHFTEAAAMAEKALQKYPNCFELVFRSAVMYCIKGMAQHDKSSYMRAVELLSRSLELIEQNEDPKISEWTIKNYIARSYMGLGQIDDAIAMMMKNNADGLNNGDIGMIYATAKQDGVTALPYLTDALVDEVARVYRIVIGYINAYTNLDHPDYESALAISKWMMGPLKGLTKQGSISYIDTLIVQLLTACVKESVYLGRMDEARGHLEEAMKRAAEFDSAPNYSFGGMRFFHGENKFSGFDDFGDTSMNGLKRNLENDDDGISEKIMALWTECGGE